MPYSDDRAVRSFRLRDDVVSYNGRLTPETIRAFRRIILGYYRAHGRDFPWRRTSDPFHVVVSEIMLQQTQADRVAEKFEEFIARFPTIGALAASHLSDVLAAWQGLGYNRRGMMLHRLARMVIDEYGGVIPDSEDELVKLPGIGPATAASISAFAFNRPAIFIETNIRALFIHFFFNDADEVPDGKILPLVEATLDRTWPYRWYSALMDYGSMLKKSHVNPGRKSAHYQKQSRFEGSRRQVRGLILKALLDRPGQSADQIALAIGHDPAAVRDVLEAMVKEGIISIKGKAYRV